MAFITQYADEGESQGEKLKRGRNTWHSGAI